MVYLIGEEATKEGKRNINASSVWQIILMLLTEMEHEVLATSNYERSGIPRAIVRGGYILYMERNNYVRVRYECFEQECALSPFFILFCWCVR